MSHSKEKSNSSLNEMIEHNDNNYKLTQSKPNQIKCNAMN